MIPISRILTHAFLAQQTVLHHVTDISIHTTLIKLENECLYSFLLITQTCIASLMFLRNKGILGFHFMASIYINCQLLLSICYIEYN